MKNLLFLSLLVFISHPQVQAETCTLDLTSGAANEALALAEASCSAANDVSDGKEKNRPEFTERLKEGYQGVAGSIAGFRRLQEIAEIKATGVKGKDLEKALKKFPSLRTKEERAEWAEQDVETDHVKSLMKFDEEKLKTLYDNYLVKNQEVFNSLKFRAEDEVTWRGFDLEEGAKTIKVEVPDGGRDAWNKPTTKTVKRDIAQKAFSTKAYKLEVSPAEFKEIDLDKIKIMEWEIANKYKDVPELLGCRVKKNNMPPLEVICLQAHFRIIKSQKTKDTITVKRSEDRQEYYDTGVMPVAVCQLGSDTVTSEEGKGKSNYFLPERVPVVMPESISLGGQNTKGDL